MSDPTLSESSLPREMRVAPNCVDIWTVPLQADRQIIEHLRTLLAPDERERALRFHAEKHQHSFVAGRGLLRTILSRYVPARPESLAFHYGIKGKPYLQDHSGLHFNLAHSGDRAVYAVASDDLGVDIELIKPVRDSQKISKRFFSQREADELSALGPDQQIAGFFACWTRKEAYIKATGEGLAAGLNKFYAGADPSDSEGGIHIDQDGRPPQWYFKDLRVGDQYAGAVVTRFAGCEIRPFNFERTEDCVRFLEKRTAP